MATCCSFLHFIIILCHFANSDPLPIPLADHFTVNADIKYPDIENTCILLQDWLLSK